MADVDTVTVRIESDDGDADELAVPAGLVDMLREGDQNDAEVLGDVVLLSAASRIHHLVAHGEGEPDEQLEAIEERTMELFEERFGQTFAEATGHQH